MYKCYWTGHTEVVREIGGMLADDTLKRFAYCDFVLPRPLFCWSVVASRLGPDHFVTGMGVDTHDLRLLASSDRQIS